jgi:ElaB/YqjD/DUF883 family membrane-anchored ribosome-binding protein
MMNATTDNRGDNPSWSRNGAPSRSTSDLEREGEEIRADLDRTLDEIERKFSPGELLDRSMEFLRDNGSEFLAEAGETIRRNPVPVVLTAAGLLWLTTSIVSSRSGSSSASERGSGGNGGRGTGYTGRSQRAYGQSEYSGSDYGSDDFGQSNNPRGNDTRGRVRSAARNVKGKLSDSMHAMQERTGEARSNFTELVQQQPVALGALALAAGALLGAALPITQYENRLVGPVHDRTMARAKEVGQRQYENLKQAVTSATERTNGSDGGGAGADRGSSDQPQPG